MPIFAHSELIAQSSLHLSLETFVSENQKMAVRPEVVVVFAKCDRLEVGSCEIVGIVLAVDTVRSLILGRHEELKS
jgi:hypothetical protein